MFVEMWDWVRADSALAAFFERLLFVELPLHRSVALDPAVARIKGSRGGPPVIIDESDAEVGDLVRALDLGYAGISHKNCNGVMKGAAHRCLLNHRNAAQRTGRHRMSGENLVNIGPVAMMQDLAVQAALGNESVERNGHHYYRGLSAFPAAVCDAVLVGHADLYTRLGGTARRDVRRGEIVLGSVNAAPFGVAAEIPTGHFEPVAL